MTRTIERIGMALAAILLVIGILWLRSCQRERTADAGAKLATGQAGAAIESGTDAVQTIGNTQAAAEAAAKIIEETKHAIQDAPDAGGITAAGRDGLCRLAAYRGKPECMHQPAPR